MLQWLLHTVRGVCMGIADAIPGVSGGTLALILGIYERFIGAISAIGPGMLRATLDRELWRRLGRGLRDPEALGDDEVGRYAGHILFLAFLVAGITVAIVTGARVIPTLLDLYPAQMKAFFFGLVLASVFIPYRMMRTRRLHHGLAFLAFAAGTFTFVGLPLDSSQNAKGSVVLTLAEPAADDLTLTRASLVFMTAKHGGTSEKREIAFGPEADVRIPRGSAEASIPIVSRLAGEMANVAPGALTIVHGAPAGATIRQDAPASGGVDPALWFLFIAGVLAISAMVLPGISGSFVLLMLGLYHYVTFNLRTLVFDRDPAALVVIAVFLAAIVVGITTFSRVLRWLLDHTHDATMAALVGLMLGSLRKLWPFTTAAADGSDANTLPGTFDATVVAVLGLFVAGVVIVLALERAGRSRSAGA